METNRIVLDLSEKDRAEMQRLMAFVGIRTESEFVSNAIELFRWAAGEMLSSRCVGSFDKMGQSVEALEIPSLAPFAAAASRLDAKRSSEEELQRRKAEAEQTTVSLSDILAEMQMRGVNRAPTQNDQAEQASPVGVG